MIHMGWNDSTRRLTIDQRQGNYPAMEASRVFRVVIAADKAFDPLAPETTPACVIIYDGQRMVVELGSAG
jgi:hypothetical protein